jgi:CheY-like chemotaxis protein
MSLILAIEPNKNQAQQLGALVRAHLKAELVTAPTAAAALSALGDRIPDVVLTPALFGLRDEEALTERLRQLGSDASHVQTLAIPILAASASKGANGGILGRKKDKGEAEVGCDPAVFAEQIRIYLQRAAVERRAQASEATARTMAAAPASIDATSPLIDDLSTFMVSADELDVDSLELTTIPPPAPAPPPAAPSRETTERRAKGKPKGHSSSPVEEELGLVTPPAAGPPLWQVTESIEDFYGNADATGTPDGSDGHSVITAARSTDASVLRPEAGNVAAHVGAHPASPLTASAATTMPRTRRTPPQPDDWAYFDASQSAFKALIRRLDEIAGGAA